MKIKEFILKNESEFKSWLIDNDYVDEDDVDDLEFEVGGYEDDEFDIIETDEICSVVDYGIDFSFDRKFVEDKYGEDCGEDELIINGKKVYVLIYNM